MAGIPQVDGAFDYYWQEPVGVPETVQSITNALHATLDPRTSNEVRGQAGEYLEMIKSRADAPQYGFTMADDFKQEDSVRYYGLQLLEHAVRYRWNEYGRSQMEQLKQWAKFLAGSVRAVDKTFIRNKIAQIWAEVAKRMWAREWSDMDKLLVTLWQKPWGEKGFAAKLLVLYILETLSEDIINGEDAVAGLRLDDLGGAMNDIMVPPALYRDIKSSRTESSETRHGEEGWLSRMSAHFAWCLKEIKVSNDRDYVEKVSDCAVKTLRALRPTMQWIHLRGPVEVNMVGCLNLAFHMYDVALQTAAAELLYALLSRPYSQATDEAWHRIMQQALLPETTAMIKGRFESIQISWGQDDDRHLLQKKLSEVVSVLADAIAMHPELTEGNVDMDAFFELLLSVLQSKSLVVSIPVLHSWTKILASDNTRLSNHVFQALGMLVQTCSARLLRYESISEADGERDETIQFLFDDFDTKPERHAFLGNYRRYCINIIQTIARTRPNEAMDHVLEQMRAMLESGPYTFGRGFDSAAYDKSQLSVLQLDAQYQVVSSALKGYSAWLDDTATIDPGNELHARAENDRNVTMNKLQQWSYGIIIMHVDDPEVAALVLTTLVTILRTVKPEPAFVLHVVQHLLTMQLYDNPSHETFSEAVKSFESLRVVELQKLALAFSGELLEVYHELEPRITVLVQKHSNDLRLVWGYRAFLFMIVHRAAGIESGVRRNRMQQMLKPVFEAWTDVAFNRSLSDLQTFCDSLALGGLDEFYKAYRFAEIADWSSQQLDEAGQARQNTIKGKIDTLPLRMTKSMLAATTEKLKSGTDEYEIGCALWSDLIPYILPSLLRMLQHAQAFHNMDSWSHLPLDLQAVVKRTLQDRFWQSGISNESKEEFYARISGSKTSYEGFASVVRGTVRNIREQGFHIVYLMTKFDEQFYGFPSLAQPLADALFADAGSLSPNHLHPAINLTNGLVQRCPPHHRASFLPPLLRAMFVKLDAKISSDWEAINQANEGSGQEDELGDEMRLESVLRQLTYSMVSFVPFLLEFDSTPQAPQQHTNGHSTSGTSSKPALSQLVLSDISILEPMMLFCTHALRMRDTRCCTTIARVFRMIIPLFESDASSTPAAPGVREFVSNDVLKACITSLNEPYFADMQKDLAMLIAQILKLYTSLTPTPRAVLLSLPDMPAGKVDTAIARICKSQSERQQRSIVLDLLEGVRGVSIYEAGKIAREPPKRKQPAVQARFMEVEQAPRLVEGEEVGLDGVAGMFGDA